MALQIKVLYKSFDGQATLERIDLSVGSSEFDCLLGPSVCGKTILLRIIAGLLAANSGITPEAGIWPACARAWFRHRIPVLLAVSAGPGRCHHRDAAG